jgi:hypothetical protein
VNVAAVAANARVEALVALRRRRFVPDSAQDGT